MARTRLYLTTIGVVCLLWPVRTAMSSAAAPFRCSGDAGYPYAYAGLVALGSQSGVAAGITVLREPAVLAGHVAAWVGVGGFGAGPGGANEWLQAGISALPGRGMALYYELTRPGKAPAYRQLRLHAALGHTYRVVVAESSTRADRWAIWIDGRPMTTGLLLPESHNSLRSFVTSESWNGGVQACNAFAFRFSDIAAETGSAGRWTDFRGSAIDAPGYRIADRSAASFTAIGGMSPDQFARTA